MKPFNSVKKTKMEKTKIFLGCLPPNTDEQELRAYFSEFCSISEMKLKYRSNKQCAGYGYFFCNEDSNISTLTDTPHYHKGRSLECRLYLSGEELKKYQEKFNKRRLYIGNLPLGTTDEQLFEFFNHISPVMRAYTLEKPDDDGKWFGFVVFKNESALEDVQSQVLHLKGNLLEVKMVSKDKNAHKRKKKSKGDLSFRGKSGSTIVENSIEPRGAHLEIKKLTQINLFRGNEKMFFKKIWINYDGCYKLYQESAQYYVENQGVYFHKLNQDNTIKEVLDVSKRKEFDHEKKNIRFFRF